MKLSQRNQQRCSLLLSFVLLFSIVFSANPSIAMAEVNPIQDVQDVLDEPTVSDVSGQPGTADENAVPEMTQQEAGLVQPEMSTAVNGKENYALNKPVTVSGNEVDYALFPKNAVDGDMGTRWSSDKNDDAWFTVDLGEKKDIGQVVIRWQTPATTYSVLTSVYGKEWENIFPNNESIDCQGGTEVLDFPSREARYVKFQGIKRKPVEGTLYGYSFYEFEVYQEDPLALIANNIKGLEPISKGQKELHLPNVPDGYKVSVFGSDALPVIGKDGVIHTPLVDKTVHVMLQVQSEANPDQKAVTSSFEVTVPGLSMQTGDLNPEPKVIPSLREWVGETGQYSLSRSSRIVVNDISLEKTAAILQEDMEDITGLELEVIEGTPSDGDIYLSLTPDETYLGAEGYLMDINDYVSIKAPTTKGVFGGTRSILQILKQDDGHDTIPKGQSRDYPKYETRGFMIDVARKFYTIDFLRDYVKMMSWYKMTDLQIHLNDDYGTDRAAFRLESERYPGLASEDGFYTKEEFRELQRLGQDYGINIIPEIDTPGHSRVFTTFDPDLGKDSHLDISKPATVEFVQDLFSEYIDGYNGGEPTFLGPDIQIGTDEYKGDTEDFRKYMDTMIKFINSKGKHPLLWGGLQQYAGKTPISNEATMAIWHLPYGGPQQAIDLGYNIINVNNSYLYLVPRLYADYLNSSLLYKEWEPVKWYGATLPFGHPQLKGGMFALWNDISYEAGLSMDDSHIRLVPAMQVLSEKMWHGARSDVDYDTFMKTAKGMGDAPNTHLSHEVKVDNSEGSVMNFSFEDNFNDASGNGYHGVGNHVTFTEGKYGKGAYFEGGDSYIQTPLSSLGFGWTVSMWIKPDAGNPENAVLMESPVGTVKLNQGNTGKLGFSKEGYNSVFDYKVPEGQWTHILLTGDSNGVSLYVNGNEYVEKLVHPTRIQTLVLPVERIGSATNSFKGTIDNLQVYNKFIPLLDVNNYSLHKTTESSELEAPWVPSDDAVDGNMITRWSSAHNDDSWWIVDLGKSQKISKIIIAWETVGKKYKILASNDKETWTNVMKDDKILEGKEKRETSTLEFEPIQARYVKFQGIERTPVDGEYYGYSFYEFEVYGDDQMIQYNALIAEAEKLVATGKGNADIRNKVIGLLNQYPYHFETEVDKLRDFNTKLKNSIENPGPDKNPDNPSPSGSGSSQGTVLPPASKEGELTLKPGEAGTVSLGSLMSVQVPAGAVKDTVTLQIKKVDPTANMLDPKDHIISSVFEVLKNVDRAFDKPIRITLTFDANKLDNKQKASIFQYDKDKKRWIELGGSISGSSISTEVHDVGIFAVFAVNSDVTPTKPSFLDIVNHWAAADIMKAVEQGIATGYPDGTFKPDGLVTRAEFAVLLARSLHLENKGSEVQYADQAEIPSWAETAIAQAAELGIITGYEDHRFQPNKKISRAEMVTMVARALNLTSTSGVRTSFNDDGSIPDWALGAIHAAVNQGLIQGRSGNLFAPYESTTRAESITVLLKALALK